MYQEDSARRSQNVLDKYASNLQIFRALDKSEDSEDNDTYLHSKVQFSFFLFHIFISFILFFQLP